MNYRCQECGNPFATIADAELAAINGCPKCGSTHIEKTPMSLGIHMYERRSDK